MKEKHRCFIFKSFWKIMVVIFCMIQLNVMSVNAATFADLNRSEVFLKQQQKRTCTLCSATMLVRRAALATGNSNWASITESAMRGTAWLEGTGLYWSFSYAGINVRHAYLSGGKANTAQLISLLKEHPEGVVIYDADKPHAILLTDYTDGVFYCADPANNIAAGRIPISSASITIYNADRYWYVQSPKVTLDKVCQHNKIAIKNASAATLISDGYTGDKYCVECDKVLEVGSIISKITLSEHPTDVLADMGTFIEFHVKSTTSNLAYQWQWSQDKGKTWTNSTSKTEGYNTDTLKVQAADFRNGYQYRCVVMDTYGNSIVSKTATLQVQTLVIITQPINQTVVLNEMASFTVSATGSNLKYQWQWSENAGKTWTNSTSKTNGYNTAVLNVQAADFRNKYQYRCVITDGNGNSVTTKSVVLKIEKSIVITSQPIDQTVKLNELASFTVSATGSNLKYQWQWRKDNGKAWTNSTSKTEGYNTAALKVEAADFRDGYQYRCVITDGNGNSVTSETAILNIK